MGSSYDVLERLGVGFESFLYLGSSFLKTMTGMGSDASGTLKNSGVCQLYGSSNTEFFLDISIMTSDDLCVASDWIVLSILFVIIRTASWTTRWFMWDPLARWHMGKLHGTETKVKKFSETMVSNLSHTALAACAWRLWSSETWLWDLDAWTVNAMQETVRPDVKFFFLLYVAQYESSLMSMPHEVVRSHSWIYALHHILTIMLVLVSAKAGYLRIASVIMFFTDWVDPIMLTAKLFRYLSQRPNDEFEFIANRLLELFSVSFFVTRNVLLTYVTWICMRDIPSSAWLLKTCLTLLVLLMTFWFYQIVPVTFRQRQKNSLADDTREGSDFGIVKGDLRKKGGSRKKRYS